MKYIIYGGFDHAVYHEMNHDSIFKGVDYFVDEDEVLIGTTYMGKEIKHPSVLLEENKEEIFIFIGSIIYHTDIELKLKDMGFLPDINYIWALGFNGDEKCPKLWHHTEWNSSKNLSNRTSVEEGEYTKTRYEILSRMIDFNIYDTLVDLGSANERVKEFIPNNIKYVPVDYMKYSDDTIFCDFTKNEFPEILSKKETTCYIALGVVCCFKDWKWWLNEISKRANLFILVSTDLPRMNRDFRREHWSHNNAAFDHEFICYLLKCGYKLKETMDFRLKSTFYKFEK